MRYYVEINGNSSLDIEGLAIKELPPITKPLIRSQIEEIDGRDGDIITELGYSAYDKSIEIGLYGNFDIDAIIKYFTGEGTITFSNEPDKFYYFKILNQIDYEKLLKFKTAVVTFHCQPFKYPVEETPIEGETITVTGSGSNITLENTVVAPMDMKLKGNTIQDETPTPTSPIPVQVVSGDNSIEVVGKNYLVTSLSGLKSYNTSGTWNNNVYSFNNLTFTINDDLSIIVNGTANANTAFFLKGGNNVFVDLSMSNGDYTLIGAVGGALNMATWCIYMAIKHSDETTTLINSYDGGVNFTKTTGDTFFPLIRINSGTQLNNVKFIPMIIPKNDSASYPISLGVENLIPFPYTENVSVKTLYGITYKTNADGSILVNGTATNNSTFTLCNQSTTGIRDTLLGKNCYLTGCPSGGSSSTYTLQLYGYGSTGAGVLRDNGEGISLSPFENSTANFNVSIYIANGTTVNNLLFKPAIIKGTKVQHISNNPIELNKIGTYQDKIDKSTGKNLWNEQWENGYYNRTTGAKGTGNTYIRSTDYIPVEESSTIYFNKPSEFTNYAVIFYDSTKTITGTIPAPTRTNSEAIEVPSTASYFTFYGDTGVANATYKNNVIITYGTTPTSYEPYGTNWYLKKEIGKVVLNGSESWIYNSTSAVFYITTLSNYAIQNNIPYSQYYKGQTNVANASQAGAYNNNTICFLNDNITNKRFYIKDTRYTNESDLKTWLQSNNTTVYYVLATPTYETITDTTLIGQLEALKPYSYNPVTNITQTNNDAPFELDVSLSYTNTMNVNNVGNIYAKPILTIEGSGTIGIILNDIEVLSVDLGTDEKITIDVPNLQAYNPDDNVLLNRNVTGDYMKLLINDGDNTIAFSGSVTSATLTNYTRWI